MKEERPALGSIEGRCRLLENHTFPALEHDTKQPVVWLGWQFGPYPQGWDIR